MKEALAWLANHADTKKDQPFFLYFANTMPHANNEANKELKDGNEIPDLGVYKDKDWKQQNKGHAAMVARVDEDLGKVMALLKEKGLDENTLVLFSSDNGPHHEAGQDLEFFKPSGPFRGIKRDLYEGGIHEPSIARWVGKIKPGSESNHVMYFGDFFATAAELVGTQPPAGLDSISFLPTLLGKEGQKEHEYLYWEFHEGGFKQGVRAGNWKGIRFPDGHVELYDLSRDVHEDHDLAGQKSDIVTKMVAYMDQAHVEAAEWPTGGKKTAAKQGRNKGKGRKSAE
jgi:arylsulfatase A-like enzyme